jgi:hypothetical protein
MDETQHDGLIGGHIGQQSQSNTAMFDLRGEKSVRASIITAAMLCAWVVPSAAQDCGKLLGRQSADAKSVRQTERAWTEAYLHGGTTYLECLLAPDYVSVSGKGPRDRTAVIGSAKKNEGKTTPPPNHVEPKVEIYGNTAVVQAQLAADPNGKYPAMYVSDVFSFYDGAWHAVYSQHTNIEANADPAKQPA